MRIEFDIERMKDFFEFHYSWYDGDGTIALWAYVLVPALKILFLPLIIIDCIRVAE